MNAWTLFLLHVNYEIMEYLPLMIFLQTSRGICCSANGGSQRLRYYLYKCVKK